MNENVTSIYNKAHKKPTGKFKLLQITDCHLGSQPHETLLGMDTDQGLQDVLAVMQSNEDPDMILVTGDISNDGGRGSYARFLRFYDNYFPNTPLAWLPGNHDDPDNMLVVGRHPIELAHQVNGWNMIFLNSRVAGSEGGYLQEAELQRLERELSANAEIPTAIFLHHQPIAVGCAWVDQYVVRDADQFFEIVDRFPQVKLISWGHVHQDFRAMRNGVEMIATPATCVQFLPNSDEFQLDTAMPGYRAYDLNANGSFTTRVGRSNEKAYAIDMMATGY